MSGTTFKTFKDEIFDNVTIREQLICADITANGIFTFNGFPLFGTNNDVRIILAAVGGINVPDATRTQLTGFSAVVTPNLGGFDATAGSWTCPTSGLYTILLQVAYVAGAGTYRNAEIFLAGFVPFSTSYNMVNDSATTGQAFSIQTGNIPAGSVFTFFTKQNSGGALALSGLATRVIIIRQA